MFSPVGSVIACFNWQLQLYSVIKLLTYNYLGDIENQYVSFSYLLHNVYKGTTNEHLQAMLNDEYPPRLYYTRVFMTWEYSFVLLIATIHDHYHFMKIGNSFRKTFV